MAVSRILSRLGTLDLLENDILREDAEMVAEGLFFREEHHLGDQLLCRIGRRLWRAKFCLN